jgi:alkanesulfonate monooxygenase SsuD/methylene tetrahydromethanopterin reductase-like flavin-dependent oxidoreductase (luciferase family)
VQSAQIVTDVPLRVGTLAAPEILRAPHRERARFIETIVAHGLDHVFVADHVSFHVGTGMDGLINAATLTALTPALNVVVGVYLLALRHPVPVARQLATLAESAPGQLILGVGVGGEDRNEVAMCGVDPRTRGRRTDESLHALRQLLDGNPVTHHGEFFSFERAWIKPAPTPPIPILIGGRADAAMRRTARYGDGWLGIWCSPQRYAQALAEIARGAAACGRPAPAQNGIQLWIGIDDDRAHARARLAKGMEDFYRVPFERFEKYSPYGTPAAVADALARYRDAGCRLFNLMPIAADAETGIAAIAEIKRLLS